MFLKEMGVLMESYIDADDPGQWVLGVGATLDGDAKTRLSLVDDHASQLLRLDRLLLVGRL